MGEISEVPTLIVRPRVQAGESGDDAALLTSNLTMLKHGANVEGLCM